MVGPVLSKFLARSRRLKLLTAFIKSLKHRHHHRDAVQMFWTKLIQINWQWSHGLNVAYISGIWTQFTRKNWFLLDGKPILNYFLVPFKVSMVYLGRISNLKLESELIFSVNFKGNFNCGTVWPVKSHQMIWAN